MANTLLSVQRKMFFYCINPSPFIFSYEWILASPAADG
jgi:hypothetical protein